MYTTKYRVKLVTAFSAETTTNIISLSLVIWVNKKRQAEFKSHEHQNRPQSHRNC